jgi:hypothetical protein
MLKEHGYIWHQGTVERNGADVVLKAGLPWLYQQFSSPQCLNTVIDFLRNLPAEGRQSPEVVAFYLSRMTTAESVSDAGVVVAAWRGKEERAYAPCKRAPWLWHSSGEIFREYVKGGPVTYGQCWVLAGVLNSMLRAAGIPARPISTFDSAHVADATPGQVDYFYYLNPATLTPHETWAVQDKDGRWHKGFYDAQGNPMERADFDLAFCTRDKVWNFHAWCDAWMERNGALDWQAVDGTYGIGPAAHSAIRGKRLTDPHDVSFVVEEVAAPIYRWVFRENPDGTFTPPALSRYQDHQPNPDSSAVGTYIVTQTPSAWLVALPATELDITSLYKVGARPVLRGPEDGCGWDVVLEAPPAVAIGDPLPYSIRLVNPQAASVTLRVNLSLAVIDYTGSTLSSLAPNLLGDFEVPPGQVRELTFTLQAADYRVAAALSGLIKAHLGVVEVSTLEVVATERRTVLAVPGIALRMPLSPVHAGEGFELSAAWTNEVGYALGEARLDVNTTGLLTLPDVSAGLSVHELLLADGAVLQTGTNFAGAGAGDLLVSATVSSPDLVEVTESRVICVGPELRLAIEEATAGQAVLSFPALNGRRYLLQSNNTPLASGWAPFGGEVLGHGTNAVVSIQSTGQSVFYRIRALPQ